MQLTTLLSPLLLAASAASTYVSYDAGYDIASRSLREVSCSDGPNGLITKYKWQVQGQVSGFPAIGGMQGVQWNSPKCGTCWKLQYGGNTIRVVALDAAYNGGFNIGLEAMNRLTNGNAEQLGHVDAVVAQEPPRACGLPF